jgi:hypothetical protein
MKEAEIDETERETAAYRRTIAETDRMARRVRARVCPDLRRAERVGPRRPGMFGCSLASAATIAEEP